jgi:hypothetical protein
LLSGLLIAAIAFVGTETYWLWRDGPWDFPTSAKVKALPLFQEEKEKDETLPLAGTEAIISKNLFDPERGAGRNREAEANSRAFQRIRGMVLLGTAILGSSRYAVLREQAAAGVAGPVTPATQANVMRLKLGDDVEGFKLTDIGDKRVVFTNGPARVEVVLDYFRKDETPAPRVPVPAQVRRLPPGPLPSPVPPRAGSATRGTPLAPTPAPSQVGPASPVVPRVIPNLPRRERIPIPRQNQPQRED